jgi:hypothetical protein
MPLDEALWMLEAGVNYQFRSVKDSLKEFVYDSIKIDLEIFKDGNDLFMVDGDHLMDGFNDLLNFTEAKLLNNEGFFLYMADVEIVGIDQDALELKMTTVAAGVPSHPWPCFIQSDDYWYPVGGQGYCAGPNQGQGIGKDASTRINGILNWNHCMGWACNQGVVFYTNIIVFNDIYEYTNPNGGSCFWDGSPDDCLNPQEMQYWVDNAFYVIDDMKPTGKVFMDVFFTYDVIVGDVWYVHYINQLRYGKLNCTGSGT